MLLYITKKLQFCAINCFNDVFVNWYEGMGKGSYWHFVGEKEIILSDDERSQIDVGHKLHLVNLMHNPVL
jgi:hypothetical protein